MHLKFVLPALLLLTAHCTFSQSLVKRHIKKGRRNKSEHQLTIDKNSFEADWEFGNEKISDSLSVFVYPNLVIRYGLTERIELNLELTALTTTIKLPSKTQYISGIEPVMAGLRYALVYESKYAPEIALSLQVAPPWLATKNYTADLWAPLLQCTMQKDLNNKIGLGASGGIFYDGFSTKPNWLYTLSSSYNFSKKVNVSAEIFGFAANHTLPLNNLDLSLNWQVNNSVMLGTTAGTGISSAAHQSYFAVNGSFTFSTKKQKDQKRKSVSHASTI
jgi:hypothetical protein